MLVQGVGARPRGRGVARAGAARRQPRDGARARLLGAARQRARARRQARRRSSCAQRNGEARARGRRRRRRASSEDAAAGTGLSIVRALVRDELRGTLDLRARRHARRGALPALDGQAAAGPSSGRRRPAASPRRPCGRSRSGRGRRATRSRAITSASFSAASASRKTLAPSRSTTTSPSSGSSASDGSNDHEPSSPSCATKRRPPLSGQLLDLARRRCRTAPASAGRPSGTGDCCTRLDSNRCASWSPKTRRSSASTCAGCSSGPGTRWSARRATARRRSASRASSSPTWR